jgi:hypothetical protein
MKMTVSFTEMNEVLPASFDGEQTFAVDLGELSAIHGKDGYTPIKGVDYFTEEDKAEMVSAVNASMTVETWMFTLEDGSVVTKKVLVDV